MKTVLVAVLAFVTMFFLTVTAKGLTQSERKIIQEQMDKFRTRDERTRELLPNPRRLNFPLSKKDISEIGIIAYPSYGGETPQYKIEIELKKPINKIETLTFYSKKIEHLIVFSKWLKEGKQSRVSVTTEFVHLGEGDNYDEDKISTCFPNCSIDSWNFTQ